MKMFCARLLIGSLCFILVGVMIGLRHRVDSSSIFQLPKLVEKLNSTLDGNFGIGEPVLGLGLWNCTNSIPVSDNSTRGAIVGTVWGDSKRAWPLLIEQHLKLLENRTKALPTPTKSLRNVTVGVVISILENTSMPMFADVIIRGGWGPGVYLVIFVKMNRLKVGEELVMERGANYETYGIPNIGHNVVTYVYFMGRHFINSSADFIIFTKTNSGTPLCAHDALHRLVNLARNGKYQFITDPWTPYRINFRINCDYRWARHPMYAKVCPCKKYIRPWINPWNVCPESQSSNVLGHMHLTCLGYYNLPRFVEEYWTKKLGHRPLQPLVTGVYNEGVYGAEASVLRKEYPRSFWLDFYDSLASKNQKFNHDSMNIFFSTAFRETLYGVAPECSDAAVCPDGWSMSASILSAINHPLYRYKSLHAKGVKCR